MPHLGPLERLTYNFFLNADMLRHGLIEGWNEPYWDNYGNYHPPGDVRERALGTFLSAAIGGVAGLAGLSNPVDDLAGLVDDLGNTAGTEARVGQRVYRVWGQDTNNPDLLPQQSGLWGRSWTRIDPRAVPDYRNAAGLPDNANLGRFISEGRLSDTTGVTTREALRIGNNTGGLDEYSYLIRQHRLFWIMSAV